MFISVAESMVTFVHRPVWVIERLSVARFHLGDTPGAERPARGGETDALDPLLPRADHGLRRRRCSESTGSSVALARATSAMKIVAGADEAFLVGESGRGSLPDSFERRLEPGGADDRRHHPIGRQAGRPIRAASPAAILMPCRQAQRGAAHSIADRRSRRARCGEGWRARQDARHFARRSARRPGADGCARSGRACSRRSSR